MNGDLLYSVPQFYGNNKAVISVARQYWHQQLEWSCSTAWPFWHKKGVFMYSWDTNVAVCLSQHYTHTHSLFPKWFLPVLYVLYSAVKCTCKHCDVNSTALLYFKGLRPRPFWVLWVYLAFQVIVKKQYRLYPLTQNSMIQHLPLSVTIEWQPHQKSMITMDPAVRFCLSLWQNSALFPFSSFKLYLNCKFRKS